MLGASGAVGGQVVETLLKQKNIAKLTILGRTPLPNLSSNQIIIEQKSVNIFEVNSYELLLPNHAVAICTLGVGEPSKMEKAEFISIDKTAVLDFAKACKNAGIMHFELLSSVGSNAKSKSFYLRIKGELIEALEALQFARLSIFQPSMIITPTNRYGFTQAIVLKVWPKLKTLLQGSARKYRGVNVDTLGKALALNIFTDKAGFEILQWDEFDNLTK